MNAWKSSLATAALVCALAALTATSARAGGYSVGVQGGASIPTGDYGNLVNSGWNLGGAADYDFTPILGAGLDLGYHAWKGSDLYNAALTFVADAISPGSTVTAKFNAFQYGAHLTVKPPLVGPVHPYARAGAAAYSLKETLDSNNPIFNGDITKTKFGWNLGAGADFAAVPTVSFGVDGQYHYVSADKDYGVNLTWFTVQGKMTFHIPLAK